MRVCLADLPAVTPPYDHALASALGRAGADVELLTGRPAGGRAAGGDDAYRAIELSARRAAGLRRRALNVVRLPVDMARLGRRARRADVLHVQWLGLEELSSHLLPRKRPRVFTAHDVLPREPRSGQRAAFGRIARAMDAVVVHTEHGAARLRAELGVPGERIHVIPHGAFEHLTRLPAERSLPAELAAVEGPVLLFFGFISHYKGVDLLLRAFAHVEGAELWVVGTPRVDMDELEVLARRAPGRVRFVPRYVDEQEIPALFRRADVVVLPYREIDQSGVLYTGLAFGRPLLVTRVGGLPKVADDHGAAVAVPPEDEDALAEAINRLLGDPSELERLSAAAERVARTEYSWDRIARRHLELYDALLAV